MSVSARTQSRTTLCPLEPRRRGAFDEGAPSLESEPDFGGREERAAVLRDGALLEFAAHG